MRERVFDTTNIPFSTSLCGLKQETNIGIVVFHYHIRLRNFADFDFVLQRKQNFY
jgi:hypothetical protein